MNYINLILVLIVVVTGAGCAGGADSAAANSTQNPLAGNYGDDNVSKSTAGSGQEAQKADQKIGNQTIIFSDGSKITITRETASDGSSSEVIDIHGAPADSMAANYNFGDAGVGNVIFSEGSINEQSQSSGGAGGAGAGAEGSTVSGSSRDNASDDNAGGGNTGNGGN